MTGHAEVTVVNQEKLPAFTKRELIRVVGGVIGLALAGVILWATGWSSWVGTGTRSKASAC